MSDYHEKVAIYRDRDEIDQYRNALRRDRRERIATAVLAGLMSSDWRPNATADKTQHQLSAEDALAYADALIAALDKEKP